jgi:hypothetical protein
MESEPKKISHILELIKDYFTIGDNNRFKFWFRGQPNFDYELLSPIFRQGNDFGNECYWESNMCREFSLLSEAQPFYTKSTFEKLILMQHYGIPTRLLDWSENLLVGLYFALYEKDKGGYSFNQNGDCSLFILDPISLNRQSENKEGMFGDGNNEVILRASLSLANSIKEYSKQPDVRNLARKNHISLDIVDNKFVNNILQNSIETAIAVFPQQNNPRLINQKGTFTLHGGKLFGNDKIINFTSLQGNEKVRLLKIRIKSEQKNLLNEELGYCGINESTLFPELVIQSDYIKKKWSEKIRT